MDNTFVKNLRDVFLVTESTPSSIQVSAAAMMRYYDNNPALAASTWSTSISSCRADQLLSLLYVANEVLQTSKRNRGNKFLESFSPLLASALQTMCRRCIDYDQPASVEKVRRTIKIWGDRRVFSLRFVNELLDCIEGYRNGNSNKTPITAIFKKRSSVNSNVSRDSPTPTLKYDNFINKNEKTQSINDLIVSESSEPLLKINIESSSPIGSIADNIGSSKKRKHFTTSAKDGVLPSKPKSASKKKTKSLLDSLSELDRIDGTYKSTLNTVNNYPESYFSEAEVDIVGDELITMHSRVSETLMQMYKQRRIMRNVANTKRELEMGMGRYIPELLSSIKNDDNELLICDLLEQKLNLLQVVHGEAKKASVERREVAERLKAQEREKERIKKEDTERRRSLQAVMNVKSQDATNMVWNPSTRQYQYQNDQTEESWRD